jgi:DNA-binding transcriptional LysR family regulator
MELRHLRYFVAVAEALSFTKAAGNLHLAQPSLTRQIKDLEAEIGVRLFDRSGKGISLTPEGESFLLDARRLLAECSQSVLAVQRLSRGEAGQLNIGYVANVYHDLLPATLGAFRKACPRIALNLFDMTPAEQYQALQERKIDLGFVCFRARSAGSNLQSASVGQDIMMVAVAEANPLAKKAKIDLKDLEPMFFVGMSQKTYPGSNDWLIDACREAGFTPRILQDADREPAVINFVAAGLGVALLPQQIKRLPHEGVIFRPLRRPLTAESWAVWKGANGSACLKQYLQIVKALA